MSLLERAFPIQRSKANLPGPMIYITRHTTRYMKANSFVANGSLPWITKKSIAIVNTKPDLDLISMKFFGDIKKWFDNQELLFYLIDMFQEQHVTSALTYTSGHEKNILMTTGISSRTATMKTAHWMVSVCARMTSRCRRRKVREKEQAVTILP